MGKYMVQKDILKETVSCAKSEYVRIGERVINAGELLALGFSVNAGQMDSLGRIYFDPKDTTGTPVAMNGTLRIWIHDASDIAKVLVFEGHTAELRATLADRTTQRVLEQRPEWCKENSRYVLFFKNDDATATMSRANSTLFIDSTMENV